MKGFPQREVLERAYQQEIDIESGKRPVVGLNKYAEDNQSRIEIQRPSEQSSILQKKRVKALKKSRNNELVKTALEKVRQAALSKDTNMIPVLKEAVKSYATVGEITSVMKEVFGTYKDPGLVI